MYQAPFMDQQRNTGKGLVVPLWRLPHVIRDQTGTTPRSVLARRAALDHAGWTYGGGLNVDAVYVAA